MKSSCIKFTKPPEESYQITLFSLGNLLSKDRFDFVIDLLEASTPIRAQVQYIAQFLRPIVNVY